MNGIFGNLRLRGRMSDDDDRARPAGLDPDLVANAQPILVQPDQIADGLTDGVIDG